MSAGRFPWTALLAVKQTFSTTSRKVLFMLYGASLLLAIVLVARFHAGEVEGLRQEARASLRGVTGTLSSQLDGSRVTRLLNRYDSRGMLVKNTQDAWYYVLHESLRKSADAAGLTAPLQVVVHDARKQELETVVTSSDKPVLRDTYAGPASAAILALLRDGNMTVDQPLDSDMLMAMDLVRDARGHIVGVLVASEPVTSVKKAARGLLWREILATALVFLAFGSLLFRKVGRLVRDEEARRNELQQRHTGITDSIAYAGKIQRALIPSPERFGEQFDDYFVIDRPKDEVSGDFHWYYRINDQECLVATADCTGHGLPGAMMAAIGCSLLNDIVEHDGSHDPAEVLAELNRRMVGTLHQEGRRIGGGDGMDIALCRIDRQSREILFAGAFRPLYWIHDGQLTVINGDRRPIGGTRHETDRRFTVHRIAYHEGDSIYLFSDGYVDQFGGPERRKFMISRFTEMILANHRMPMALQAAELERAFLAWKGEQEQVDDICVLGLAV